MTLLNTYRQKIDEAQITADPAQEMVVVALQNLLDDIQNPPRRRFFQRKAPPVKGLYVWGGVGRGKTMLMDLFFHSLPPAIPARRVHFHEFMIGVHEALHEARRTGQTDKILPRYAATVAAHVRVLCFDEFHVTDIADAMILGRLFSALFDQGVIVVATSNWPPERLYEGGLQRDRFLPFIALVEHRMSIMELDNGIDYRLQCLSDTGVYFTPLGEGSRRKADDVFARLTGNATVYDEILTVKGRAIHVEKVAKGVARFTFAQLCEMPRGAEDYLQIARAYHTVFLEGVPKLTYDRRNEAKRLMILVDALYDNDVKLVMTADARPEDLYRGHDHAYEFERTISRLIEMQSVPYLEGKHESDGPVADRLSAGADERSVPSARRVENA